MQVTDRTDTPIGHVLGKLEHRKKPCLRVQQCFYNLIPLDTMVLDAGEIILNPLKGLDLVFLGEKPCIERVVG